MPIVSSLLTLQSQNIPRECPDRPSITSAIEVTAEMIESPPPAMRHYDELNTFGAREAPKYW